MPTLETLRRRQMLTQAALAQRAKVASSTVYLIERGEPGYRPRFAVIQKISAALGVEPKEVDEFRSALGIQFSGGHADNGGHSGS